MELQPRDLQILETIGELGTADTTTIHGLYFPNDKTGRACQRRLKIISDAGLLKSVRLVAVDGYGLRGNSEDYKPSGSLSNLYFLTESGGDVVERETGIQPLRVTRSDPKQLTLRHRIETVRARLAIDRAAKLSNLPDVAWIMEQDRTKRVKAAKGRSPSEFQILNNAYQDEYTNRTVAFRPDAAFHLQVPRPSGNGFKSLLGYIELDRSTEGHRQWEGKLLGIEAFIKDDKAWHSHWPGVTDPAIVLFVICKTNERLGNLAITTRPSAVAKHVRMATFPLNPETVLTQEVWQDCHGQLYAIVKNR